MFIIFNSFCYRAIQCVTNTDRNAEEYPWLCAFTKGRSRTKCIYVNNGQKAIDIRLYTRYNICCIALFYLIIRRGIFEKRRKDKRGVGLSDTKFNKGEEMSYISK